MPNVVGTARDNQHVCATDLLGAGGTMNYTFSSPCDASVIICRKFRNFRNVVHILGRNNEYNFRVSNTSSCSFRSYAGQTRKPCYLECKLNMFRTLTLFAAIGQPDYFRRSSSHRDEYHAYEGACEVFN